jgi:hypothetical protein
MKKRKFKRIWIARRLSLNKNKRNYKIKRTNSHLRNREIARRKRKTNKWKRSKRRKKRRSSKSQKLRIVTNRRTVKHSKSH